MKYEYLIYNALIISGPVVLSFDRKVRYVNKWIPALVASLGAAVPFLLWDVLVTGRHWWFNERFTLDTRILGLPPGEWLFFITVPFATLFIWEIFSVKSSTPRYHADRRLLLIGLLFGFTGIPVFILGKEYTGLVLFALGLIMSMQYPLKNYPVKRGFIGKYLFIVTALMVIFNGYLTARPVVEYDPGFQTDLRILTIPVEDFLYGYALILLAILLYEKLKERLYV